MVNNDSFLGVHFVVRNNKPIQTITVRSLLLKISEQVTPDNLMDIQRHMQ